MIIRVFEFISSALGIILLSPLMLIISCLIKFDSKGPILYSSERIGKGGELFSVYKFRSMKVGADKEGPQITVEGDNRVTAIGRVLRKTKLDELPQLFNVLMGSMSLVGPRPEVKYYVDKYTPLQKEILSFKPGITSPASLQFRNEEEQLQGPDWEKKYLDTVMPRKISVDLEYCQNKTLVSDLKVIFKTILVLFVK